MSKLSRTVGIDFGSHKTLVARWDEEIGRPVLVRLRPAHGDDMPSAVHVNKDGNMTFGDEALEVGLTDPDGLQRSFKRDLGKSAAPYLLHAFEHTPEELTAQYLGWIKAIVEEHCLHGPIEKAVFTVPASWLPCSREALAKAASEAGFGDIDLLEEPVAAGIAFLRSRKDLWPEDEILVFDWGAGTLDLAVLTLKDSQPHAVPDLTGGDPNLGGDDIDSAVLQIVNQRLVELGLAKLERRSPEELELLRRKAIEWKIRHRNKPDAIFAVTVEGANSDYTTLKWSGDCVNLRMGICLTRAAKACQELIHSAKNRGICPKGILLIGGSSQMPEIAELLRNCDEAPVVLPWDQQMVAVALGAAWFAAFSGSSPIKQENDSHDEDESCCSMSIDSEENDNTCHDKPLDQGVTSRVSVSGIGDYSSIKNALQNAVDGCVILLECGEFDEPIQIPDGISVTIRPRELDFKVSLTSPKVPVIYVGEGAELTLENVTVNAREGSKSGGSAVEAWKPDVITIKRCKINGSIRLHEFGDLTLIDCKIVGVPEKEEGDDSDRSEYDGVSNHDGGLDFPNGNLTVEDCIFEECACAISIVKSEATLERISVRNVETPIWARKSNISIIGLKTRKCGPSVEVKDCNVSLRKGDIANCFAGLITQETELSLEDSEIRRCNRGIILRESNASICNAKIFRIDGMGIDLRKSSAILYDSEIYRCYRGVKTDHESDIELNGSEVHSNQKN